jgi:hypothetical protein
MRRSGSSRLMLAQADVTLVLVGEEKYSISGFYPL